MVSMPSRSNCRILIKMPKPSTAMTGIDGNKLPPVTHEVIGSRGVLQFVAAGLGEGFVFMHNDNIRHENIIFRNVPVKLNRSLLAGFRDGSTAPVVNNFLRLLSETLPKTELC